MPIDKLLLDGPVKPFQIAIGLRMLRVIKEMCQPLFLAGILKVFSEFTAVVSLNSPGDKGSHFKELVEEITAIG